MELDKFKMIARSQQGYRGRYMDNICQLPKLRDLAIKVE